MPALADLLPLVYRVDVLFGLILSAAVIVLLADWRLALFALTAQYLLAAMLLLAFVQPSVALVRAISGALAAAILYITLRQNETRQPVSQPQVFVVGLGFRAFALAFAVVGIAGVASSMLLLGLSGSVLFSGVWLIAMGILVAIVSRDVLRLGCGILMFTSGFCILEMAVEGSLFLYGLLNISDLLLAVVVAHLATLPHDASSPRRRRGESP